LYKGDSGWVDGKIYDSESGNTYTCKEMGCLKNALILNFDDSVRLPDNVDRLDLRSYEEKIRYYARFSDMASLESVIKGEVEKHRVFFLGNGDFHHISYLLLKQIPQEKLQVIVFDNHPDNMFLPWGIHCGSWVYHASKLPNVSNIAVFGVASKDIRGLDLIQNRFSVIRSGKVKYYCLTPVNKLARLLSGFKIEDVGVSTKSIIEILREHVKINGGPVYLSVDKDVLLSDVVRTTWDQGRMSEKELLKCVEEIAPTVIAADIVGDISFYNYRNSIKRIMRWVDGYEKSPFLVEEERFKHMNINMKIFSLLR